MLSNVIGTRKRRDLGKGTCLKVRPWLGSQHWAGGLLPSPTVKKAKALPRVVGESTGYLCDIWQVTVWSRDEEGQCCGQEGIKRFLPAFGV